MLNARESEVNLWGVVSSKTDTSYNLDTEGDTRQRSKASEIREVDGARIAVQVVRNRRKKRVAYRSDVEAHKKKDLEKKSLGKCFEGQNKLREEPVGVRVRTEKTAG